jgi:fructosamine-3-kinase
MFKTEYNSLQTLKSQCPLLVPEPIALGRIDNWSYLLMEFIQTSAKELEYWQKLGEGLAVMHRATNKKFGWDRNNYIGRLPQSNQWHQRWLEFYISERLLPQMNLAGQSGELPSSLQIKLEQLCSKLDHFFVPEPSAFLHGDLWSGNLMIGPAGEPCLVDPAVYFGHREIEIAFTTLFGGFDDKFYQAYHQSYPLEPGFRERVDLYNLYPLLVHLNLFGSGYLGEITRIVNRYI